MEQKTPIRQINFRGYTFPSSIKLSYTQAGDLKRAVGSKLWSKLQKNRLLSIIDFMKDKEAFRLYKITYSAYNDVKIEVI